MKKLFLFAIASSFAFAAGAQFQVGLKGGLNLADLSLSPKSSDENLSIKPDFHAGIVAAFHFNSMLSVQPEVMYSGQGTKYTSTEPNSPSINYNFGYVSVPVLVKYTHTSGLFAELGPQVNFLVSGKIKSGSQSEDVKSELKSSDFSAVAGIGYLSKYNIGIDARYNLGFTNILKDTENGTLKNRVIQVGVFYLFGHAKK